MKYGILVFIALGFLLAACGEKKKKNMADGEEVTVQEFIEFYPEISLPFTYSDTSFPKKEEDSLLIGKDIFYKFTPDSSVAGGNVSYYPVGRFSNGEDETYLLTRAISKDRKILLLSAYDKEKKYIAQLPVIRVEKQVSSKVSVTIDPKFNISKNVMKKLAGGAEVQGHDVYILNNSSKQFMLVMTDSLGEASGELVNPIDTLPRTQKYAGDYGDSKNALISFRDGQREGRMHLFMHFNTKDSCSGELKGEVTFTAPTVAEYRQGGDPCILQFIFSNSAVKIREVQGCGSRLGALQCSFNGNYKKRKMAEAVSKE